MVAVQTVDLLDVVMTSRESSRVLTGALQQSTGMLVMLDQPITNQKHSKFR